MSKRFVVPSVVAVFIAVLSVYFIHELTPGMGSDNSDWVMYVTHARNIATHHPYSESGYVYQPESTTEVGARAYPSGLPLMLAPIYSLEGFNLRHFKTINALFLALSLWPAFLYARRTLSELSALCIVVVLGFSSLFLLTFNAIGSDSPYELVSLAVLLLLLRLYDQHWDESKPWIAGVCAGAAITAAYLLRPLGIAFLVALGLYELLRKRRIGGVLIAATLTFLPLLVLNNYFFHADGGYMHQFTFSVKAIARHAAEYAGFFSYAFLSPAGKLYRYGMWALAIVPFVIGLLGRWKAGFGIPEIYFFTILAVDSVYWQSNPRYLLPLMPLYLAYLFEGLQAIAKRVPGPGNMALKGAAALALLVTPAANALLYKQNPNDTLLTKPEFEALCAVLREQAPANSLILFWNPRVLFFDTSRNASGWPAEGDRAEMEQYLRRVKPAFVVIDKKRDEDNKYLLPATAADPVVYENDEFKLVAVPVS